jgi:hypothetical protein
MNARRVSALLMAALAVVVLGIGTAPAFGAPGRQTTSPEPVTDYENYPLGLGIIPDGCTAQGADLLVGEQFSMNGGAAVSTLWALGNVPSDAVLTMTWTGYAAGCEGIGVSLSRKVARQKFFDAADNQYLNVWSYCGPDAQPCAGMLVLDLGADPSVACYQLDANAGPPLQVVGPAGSFYSLNGQFNTLISANNGGTGDCTPAPCLVPGAPADLPANADACEEPPLPSTTDAPSSSTTEAPSTSTTEAPVTTQPPVTTEAPQTTSTTQSPVTSGPVSTQSPANPSTTAAGQLPATGAGNGDLARFGVTVLAAGMLLAAATRRWRTA